MTPAVDDDRDVLERAWGLATLPIANTSYTNAVLDLLSDGDDGVCPRALQMFELAVEVAMMSEGSLAKLIAAWTRGQLFAPKRRVGVQMWMSVANVCQ